MWRNFWCDFPDQDVSVEEQRITRRVVDLNEDFKARMAALNEAEHKRAEEIAIKREKFTQENNRRIMLQEWSRVGVEPPDPLVSVELALSLGCQFEEICGEKVLKIPNRKFHSSAKRREDYGNVDGS